MPFPNPGAQGAEPSCSITAAGACVQQGSSIPGFPCPLGSLMFGILAGGNPPTEPWSPSWDLGMVFLSQKKNLPSSWGIFSPWKVGPTLSSSRLPSRVTFPRLRQDPFPPVWDTGSMCARHHSQLIQIPGKSLLLPTPIPFGLPGTQPLRALQGAAGWESVLPGVLALSGAPPGAGEGAWDGRICPAPRDEPAASLGMAAPFPSRASLSLVQRRVCRERKESALPGKEVLKEVLHEILLLTPLMSVGCGRHCLLLEKLIS